MKGTPLFVASVSAAIGCTPHTPTAKAPGSSFGTDVSTESQDGWTCQWTEGHGRFVALHGHCEGIVSCRHETMLFFMPQVYEVSCPASKGACDPTECFLQNYMKRSRKQPP